MEHVDQQVETTGPEASRESETRPDEAAVAEEASTPERDEVQTLREELAAAQRYAADNEDKYLRARAEMENFRKRIERTYADLTKTSKKDLLRRLLAVKDNLERALHYGDTSEGAGEGIIEGVRLTQYQLDQLLAQEGVKPIESEGKPFDPRLEEAVQSIHDPNVPDHTVVQVVRKGYTYQDENEVLRPAQVIVNVHESDS
jgi:molecular chaperone GrpE